mmetsp:Transcript_4125/g.8907  ORF Transcript_4125/g.8907 Transcript_4125/m.8907 type:complete len:243 (+) Transcript_4125:213-941(+)
MPEEPSKLPSRASSSAPSSLAAILALLLRPELYPPKKPPRKPEVLDDACCVAGLTTPSMPEEAVLLLLEPWVCSPWRPWRPWPFFSTDRTSFQLSATSFRQSVPSSPASARAPPKPMASILRAVASSSAASSMPGRESWLLFAFGRPLECGRPCRAAPPPLPLLADAWNPGAAPGEPPASKAARRVAASHTAPCSSVTAQAAPSTRGPNSAPPVACDGTSAPGSRGCAVGPDRSARPACMLS